MKLLKVNSRVPVWIHLSVFLAINIAAIIVIFTSIEKNATAKDSVFLVQENIKRNRDLLNAGNAELRRSQRNWEGALVLIERLDKYKSVSDSVLSGNAAAFKNMIDALTNQNRLLVMSYDAQAAGTIKFGNYTYDGRMFDITVKGAYRDLGAFITALENKVPLMEISNFRMVEDSTSPGQLIMSVQAFVIRDIQESRAKIEASSTPTAQTTTRGGKK